MNVDECRVRREKKGNLRKPGQMSWMSCMIQMLCSLTFLVLEMFSYWSPGGVQVRSVWGLS